MKIKKSEIIQIIKEEMDNLKEEIMDGSVLELSKKEEEEEDKEGYIINEEEEWEEQDASELVLYSENVYELYNRYYLPMAKNLTAKKARGTYDRNLAVKLFMYLTDAAAKYYAKDIYENPRIWNKVFPKQVRFEAAKSYVEKFEMDYEDGEFDEYIPKKYRTKKEEIIKDEKNRK